MRAPKHAYRKGDNFSVNANPYLARWAAQPVAADTSDLLSALSERAATIGSRWERKLATEFKCVPLGRTTFASMALTGTGEFIEVRGRKARVGAPILRLWYLRLACRKYPELGHLLPALPPESVVCSQCAGSGKRRSMFGLGQRWCLSCNTLGWVPAESHL